MTLEDHQAESLKESDTEEEFGEALSEILESPGIEANLTNEYLTYDKIVKVRCGDSVWLLTIQKEN